MTRLRLLGVSLWVLGVLGCAAPTTTPVAAPAPTTAAAAPTLTEARPAAVTIPALDVTSTLIPTGLTPDGAPEVPPIDRPEQASWYCPPSDRPDGRACDWPMPGQPGPAVLFGHVDGSGRPGVFADLVQLDVGDEVLVDRVGGPPLRFVVDAVEQLPKAAFDQPGSDAVDAVYGPTDGPELRLVTCGGAFDEGSGHYLDQVVVSAHLAA